MTAKEMFEALGFEYNLIGKYAIVSYKKEIWLVIQKNSTTWYCDETKLLRDDNDYQDYFADLTSLSSLEVGKAIIQQKKELGWLKDEQ